MVSACNSKVKGIDFLCDRKTTESYTMKYFVSFPRLSSFNISDRQGERKYVSSFLAKQTKNRMNKIIDAYPGLLKKY